MRQLLHEFLLLCGSKGKRVKQSVIFGFFDGIFEAMPFCAVFYLFYHLEQLSWNASFLTLSDAGIVAAIFLVGVIGRWIMKFCIYRFQSVASYEAIADARLAVGDHLKQAPMGFFNSETIGNTVTTLTDDMHYIEQNAANILEKTINGCINVFVMTLGVFVFDWRLGLIFLMGAILSLAIISSMQKAGISVAAKAKESQNAANGKVVEYLHGLSIYKLFPGSRQQSVNIKKVFGDLRDASFNMEKTFIRKNLSYTLVIRLACGIITILTALLAFGGQMGIAKAAVLLIATFVLYQPLENLGNISAMVRMMEVSLKRIEKMKKMPVMEGENQTPLQYDIRFENVSFQYEQNQSDVIHDVSFYIPEKEMTAIVGPSGCGKTTLTRLMARFWDVGSGCVSIGGIDVRKIHPEQLYSYFSIVFQNVFLFHDTIENNIKFGNPAATHEEVVAAAKKACCHDFIQSLPDGYATMVEENGGNLSGGEKQRISIARAILKDAPIILLDEATSSVDPENEWMLQQAIQELTAGKTVVMIAHKIKTIMNAGQIIVMDNGRVHGIGTHEALLQSDEIYRTFWDARRTASQWKI